MSKWGHFRNNLQITMTFYMFVCFLGLIIIFISSPVQGDWVNETICSNIGSTYSVVYDSSDHPHMLFKGSEGNIYLHYNGSQWVREDIPFPSYLITRMFLDKSENPVFVYITLTPSIDSRNELKFAKKTDKGWESDLIDTNVTNICLDSLILNETGIPYIAYTKRTGWATSSLLYAFKSDHGWLNTTIDQGSNYPLISMNQSGYPDLVYTFHSDFDGTSKRIYHAYHTPSGYLTNKISQPSSSVELLGLQKSSLNNLSLLYHDPWYGDDFYICEKKSDSGWSVINLLSNPQYWNEYSGIIQAPNKGDTSIAYIQSIYYELYDSGSYKGTNINNTLGYLYKSGDSWIKETIKTSGFRTPIFLTFNQSNSPHLFYRSPWGLQHAWKVSTEPPKFKNIIPSVANNEGISKVRIVGSNFQSNILVSLIKGDSKIPASQVEFINSSEILCNFNVTDVNIGLYDLVLKNPDLQEVNKRGAFLVINNKDSLNKFNFQKTYGGTESEYNNIIKNTTDGGFILLDSSNSNDFDVTRRSTFKYPGFDLWIVKLSPDYQIKWEKCFGGSGDEWSVDIIQTQDGGFAAIANTCSNDGDVSGYNGNQDIWVIKLDSDGNLLWQKCLGGTLLEAGKRIHETSDGGFLVIGDTNSNDLNVSGNHGSYDAWVVKLAPATGNIPPAIEWQRCFGGSKGDTGLDVVEESHGNYLLVGSSESTDGDLSGISKYIGYWIASFDSNRNITRQARYGGSNGADATDFIRTSDGNYLISGYTNSYDGNVTGKHGKSDIWIVKVNKEFELLWEKCLGGDGYDNNPYLIERKPGQYIIKGYTDSNNGDITKSYGNGDLWVVKINDTPTIEWESSIGTPNKEESGYPYGGLIRVSDNEFLTSGSIIANDGKTDLWIFKVTDKDTDVPVINNITPSSAPNTTPVSFRISGSGFKASPLPIVNLTKEIPSPNPTWAESDKSYINSKQEYKISSVISIPATNVTVPDSGNITGIFNITRAVTGKYDLNVRNGDGQIATKIGAFEVTGPSVNPKLVTDTAVVSKWFAVLSGHIMNVEPGVDYPVSFRYEGGATPKTKVGLSIVNQTNATYRHILTELSPGTTYYYRAVHRDSAGPENPHAIDADNVESFVIGDSPSPTITSITPSSAPNTTSVQFRIFGSNFQSTPLPIVNLTKAFGDDQVNITATNVAVPDSGNITGTFDLTGARTGTYDLVVKNGNGQSVTKNGTFEVTGHSTSVIVNSIEPSTSSNDDIYGFIIRGAGFTNESLVTIAKPGTSITRNCLFGGPDTISVIYHLQGVPAGIYNVTVTNPDGMFGKMENALTIEDKPPKPLDSKFIASVASGQVPLEVTFYDQSNGNPTSWLWEFGDGTVSNQKNPTHTYANTGNYMVNLTVSDGTTSRKLSQPDYIVGTPDDTGDMLKISSAVSYAAGKVNTDYYGNSLTFINDVYQNGSGYAFDSPIENFEQVKELFKRANRNQTLIPPKGSIAMYQTGDMAFALSEGNGNVISCNKDHKIIRRGYNPNPEGYIGWAFPIISGPTVLYLKSGEIVNTTWDLDLKKSIWNTTEDIAWYKIEVFEISDETYDNILEKKNGAVQINSWFSTLIAVKKGVETVTITIDIGASSLRKIVTSVVCLGNDLKEIGKKLHITNTVQSGYVSKTPVVLIHGWMGDPSTFNRLIERLKNNGYSDDEIWIFDFKKYNNYDPRDIAKLLKAEIKNKRDQYGYRGKVDIVCHSMGALVSRWYIEKLDGKQEVRQWIGIAPANNGAAIADKLDEKADGNLVRLIDAFFGGDGRKQLRTDSKTVEQLSKDVTQEKIIYHVIVGVNDESEEDFFKNSPPIEGVSKIANNYKGTTWTRIPGTNTYRETYCGDGMISAEQSRLKGASFVWLSGLDHSIITHNDRTIDLVVKYLENPNYESPKKPIKLSYTPKNPMVGGIILFDGNLVDTKIKEDYDYWWAFGYLSPNSLDIKDRITEKKFTTPESHKIIFYIERDGKHIENTETLLDLNLEMGDILFDRSGGFNPGTVVPGQYSHVGMYIGNEKVIEALALGAEIKDLKSWDSNNKTYVAVYRVKGLNSNQRDEVVKIIEKFANPNSKAGYDYLSLSEGVFTIVSALGLGLADSFDDDIVIAPYGKQLSCKDYGNGPFDGELGCGEFYCSELVWYAYKMGSNIDLDTKRYGDLIAPQEIADNYQYTSLIGVHYEEAPMKLADPWLGIVKCPVNITITDPFGRKLSRDNNQIPDSYYHEDYNETNNEVEKFFIIASPLAGNYSMNLIPDTSADPNSTYSFEVYNIVNTSYIHPFFSSSGTIQSIPDEPIIIKVPDKLQSQFFADKTVITQSEDVKFLDYSSYSPINWTWDFGDGTFAYEKNPIHTYKNTGNYSVSLTVMNLTSSDTLVKKNYISVLASPTYYITSTVSPNGTITPSGSIPVPEGTNQTFTITPNLSNYIKDVKVDNISVGQVKNYTFYNVTSNHTIYAEFAPDPVTPIIANFTANLTSGTIPLSIQFTDTSTGFPTSWFWTFGDGGNSTTQNPVHTYLSAGFFTVNLTASKYGNSNTKSAQNYINATPPILPPSANFTANFTSGPIPLTIQFTDTSTGSPTSWLWTFGDGGNSTTKDPVHTYSKSGLYTVNLTVSNSVGSNTKSAYNYINATSPILPPITNFTANITSGPIPLTIQFTDTSTGSPTSWVWTFGDGGNSTNKDPVHTYSKSGLYTVNLTASNSGGSNTKSVKDFINATIKLTPSAAFTFIPSVADINQEISFNPEISGPDIATILWNFGDGTKPVTSYNPVYQYKLPGRYNVTLTVTNPYGTATASHIVPVRGLIPYFKISPDNWSFVNTQVTFSDESMGGPVQWFWNFGDGNTVNTTQTEITHSYSQPGTYIVNMTTTNWQPVTKSMEKTYVVYEKTVPRNVDFALPDINQTGVAPFNVRFIDTTPKLSNVTGWLWDFGDGSNSVEQAPNHTYTVPGQYTVVLTVRNEIGTNEIRKAAFISVT